MIAFKNLRQYTHVVDGLRFPQDPKNPFLLVYFSENSNFLIDYPRLNLRLIDFRLVAVPITRIPRTRLTPDLRKLYTNFKLIPYSAQMKFPEGRNLILDLSQYPSAIDAAYNPRNYRQRAGMLIKNFVETTIASFTTNYNVIFIYSVDLTKDMNQFIDRKIFPFLKDFKDENLPFNTMILAMLTEGSARYRLLIKDKHFKFERIRLYLRSVKPIDDEQEMEEDLVKGTTDVINNVDKDLNPATKDKVVHAVASYLKNKPDELDQIMTGQMKPHDAARITTASILFKTSNDLSKADRISSSVPPDRMRLALKAVDRSYSDQLLKPQRAVSISTDARTSMYDTPRMVDYKSPIHVFQKRQLDFEMNLIKDIVNSFQVLENQEIPLKFVSIQIHDKSQNNEELKPSDLVVITIILKDKFGKLHSIDIEIPKIDVKTGTFRVRGQRKCLINQIIQKPITFPAAGESKFESSYSIFRIVSRKLARENYLETFMIYRLPMLILISFAFGFEESMKLYDLKYQITTEKPDKQEIFSKINDTEYIIFKNVNNALKQQLVQSFIHGKVFSYDINEKFGSPKYFEKLIIKLTGRLNSTFLIMSSVRNIVDPVVKQILKTDQLPTDLPYIMKYMAEKVIEGYVIDRNDISNQRVRTSEVLVTLIQKQILAAYTIYKEQVLSGNESAIFEMSSTKVLKEFQTTELAVNMEYANPIEEMATITRVSPTGKAVSGIPDKRAIQTSARNIHETYFGNLDPLDTPEGENIGITQQLTIDPNITSARGLFGVKDKTDKEKSGILSTTTCMVPFLENNDGARVIMISQQAKQIVPLKNPSPPAVQSGYEGILTSVLSENFIKRSPCDGKIETIVQDKVSIRCKTGRTVVDISPVHLKSGSGKDTLSIFVPTVNPGNSVREGAIIAEGSCISSGAISLGRTLCVALMPYKGYNFEDGIVINEDLVADDSLTSVHGIMTEAELSVKDKLIFIEQVGTSTVKGQPLLKKTVGELEELIQYEELEDIDITGRYFVLKSPGGRIVDVEVFSNVPDKTFPDLQELINKTNQKYGRNLSKKFTMTGDTIKGVLIKFKIEQELKIGLGDKLCNRYGNKGIISLLEKPELMPRTPFGERIDIIFNPIGLIGRMNMGQLFEMYCGLVSKYLAKYILASKNRTKIASILKPVLQQLDTSKNKEYTTAALMRFSKLSSSEFARFLDGVQKTGFFPLVIPPFKAPPYQNIIAVLKLLGLKSGYTLTLPEFNTKTKSPVPVGYMYVSKLEHIGDLKIYGRSTGPVAGKTGQPTSGKKREGGQRLGEQDTYCFISYNCQNLLAELMGPLSDDFLTRDAIISEIVQKGDAKFREPTISSARNLLNSYFVSLMLERA
jgi:DNA-directed RNA polymerase beta subunit